MIKKIDDFTYEMHATMLYCPLCEAKQNNLSLDEDQPVFNGSHNLICVPLYCNSCGVSFSLQLILDDLAAPHFVQDEEEA